MNATLRDKVISMSRKFADINNYDPRLIFDMEYRQAYIDFVNSTYDEDNTPFHVISQMKQLCDNLLNIAKPEVKSNDSGLSIDMVTNVKFPILSLVEVLANHWGHNYPLHVPVLITSQRETTDPIFCSSGCTLRDDFEACYGNFITNKKGIILPATPQQVYDFVNSMSETAVEKILNDTRNSGGVGSDNVNNVSVTNVNITDVSDQIAELSGYSYRVEPNNISLTSSYRTINSRYSRTTGLPDEPLDNITF
jgi:hypothetical protein